MQDRLGLVLLTLVAFASSDLPAQQKLSACTLLTNDEIGGATGAQIGKSMPSDIVIPDGPAKGETIAGCMWKAGEQGMVTISVMRAAKGAEREKSLAKLHQTFDRLRAKGWTEQKETFSGGTCAVMTPPPSSATAPAMTGCMAEAKGMGISVGFMSPKETVANGKLKTLLDKIVARLP